MTTDRFEGSRRQHERAKPTLAGGVATAFRAGQRPVPISFERGAGAHLWDVDSNEYVDYALAFGPMLLGHSPEPVITAVERQLRTGIGYGASHRLEAELAELVVRTVPSAELCAFGSTGSEAVHVALRIARAATGRNRVIKFQGHYHGWLDTIHVGVGGTGPGTVGQDPAAAASVTVCRWNDLAALEAVLDDDVAAIIMEPINVNAGAFSADPAYLAAVRRLTHDRGIVLIFDEVITGFRVALGGAQERLGITPDLSVLGKALGSGFPVSAVCGSAAVMSQIATGRVAHVGTFNLNPIGAAAAVAAVGHLEQHAATIYPRLEAHGRALRDIWVQGAASAGLPIVVNQVGAAAHAFVSDRPVPDHETGLTTDIETYRRFVEALLRRGVHAIGRGLMYVSTAHEDADLAFTREAVVAAAADVQAARRDG
ncbi:MAG: aminotransferase class III-fold pyridoxal phosphate-dependent enzyme [Chloroflexi bacterium]|nr:aminotransferase class III-fold pyridoxal phosphate-dependent enzyme [Chloroflexota bacterium]